MKPTAVQPADDSADEIAMLVRRLNVTKQRLEELTGGGVDAVIRPGGQSYSIHTAQAKLRESEERFHSMFSAAAAGIAILSPEGRFLQANATYCRMLGYTEEELQMRDSASVTHPEDLELQSSLRDELRAGKRADYVIEKRYLKKNGEILWARASASAVSGEQGETTMFIVVTEDITERKNAQAALKAMADGTARRERMLTTMLSALSDFTYLFDRQGRFLFVNQALLDLWGITLEEATGKNYSDLKYPPALAARLQRQVQQVFETGQRVNGEAAYTSPTGTTGYYEYTFSPASGPDGQVEFVVGCTHNITERKRAEDALRASENRFKALFEQAAVGVSLASAETGRFLLINRRYCEIVGRSPEDVMLLTAAQMTHPDYLDRDLRLVSQVKAGTLREFTVEKRYLRKDRSEVWAEVTVTGIGEPGAPPDYFLAIVLDMEARKRSEGRLRRLVESNAQSVYFWNRNGQITDANDSFLQLVGHSRADLASGLVKWTELTPSEYSKLDQRALEEIAAQGTCTPYEKEFLGRNGTRVPVFIGAASFEDNPNEGVSFVLDLTERKRLERQFLRAQRMESIGTLAGGIAHDLNNILAPIMMSIEMLKTTSGESPEGRKILQTIGVSATRGAAIVRQVLSFARGMNGERVEVQPKHLLHDLETIVRDTFPRDIRLEFSIPHNIWTILGDPTQIHQILLNLSVNARDAMPDGGSLVISAENCELDEHYVAMNLSAKAGRYVSISVTDSGVGIAPAILDKIFEPFFTTKEINKSTGLGLSTVMAIVKSHQGIINVDSEVGKGTTFKVYLPALEAAADARKEQLEYEKLPRGNGETVLVVDDEASIRSITSQTLQAFGYRVIAAVDGADAIATYAENKSKIAVVLTDMMMPVLGGLAMIHALKRMNPAVKVLTSSGLDAKGDQAESHDPALKHFLLKPYTAVTLLKAVRAILDEP